jgi:hypothetical protein
VLLLDGMKTRRAYQRISEHQAGTPGCVIPPRYVSLRFTAIPLRKNMNKWILEAERLARESARTSTAL